jgi:hypothetical protein
MTFVPEDGTGLADANSLVSLEYANAYWADRPSTAGKWATASDPEKQEALLDATREVSAERFLGSPLSGLQALPLPRYWPTIDGRWWGPMPTPILEAVCELAKAHLDTPLNKALKRGGEIQVETLGPLSKTYFPGAPGGNTFPYVSDLLAPFVEGGAELVLS